MSLRQELDDVISTLSSAEIEYAVCGGMAMAVHGYPRFTEDLDILIRESDLDAIKEAVASLGFVIDTGWLRFGAGTNQEISLYRLVKAAGRNHLILDLICVTPALQTVWDSKVAYDLHDQVVSVVSRDGLVTMKKISGRDQDLVDIQKLQGEDND